ncbi:MAG: hypothetical protein IJ602_03045 [Paludibacteraceae bacterium]|nr:hypothetical protein [Paludibacteraceae bacterium]
MNINDYYESTQERRNRRNKDIKAMFQELCINQNVPCMEAYEIVGYYFYLSAMEVRRIIANANKNCSN